MDEHETVYYRINYAGHEYSTDNVDVLRNAIKTGAPVASFLINGSGDHSIEVEVALGGIPVSIERRVRTHQERRATILR